MVGILFGGFQRTQRSVRHIYILKELRISCLTEQWWHRTECLAVKQTLTIKGRLKWIICVKISGWW